MTSTDLELQRHQQTWHGFTRLLKIGTTLVVILLILLALFLL
jgi:Bacterial aa3 type cytochrome c oxidase subunit IV